MQFSCKITIDPKIKDTKNGRSMGRSMAALETNRMQDGIRVRIGQHYQEIVERDNFVTAEKVKNAFRGLEHRCHTLMKVFAQYNEDHASQVEVGMKSVKTLWKYQVVYQDLFLFCIFTGLSFSDMSNPSEENLRTYFDEHLWIRINRQKTGVESNIRLLDIPTRIIEKYRGLCADGRIFPVPHYTTCVYGIRTAAKRCGITKHLTWHMSRHTMATEICPTNVVPIETVKLDTGAQEHHHDANLCEDYQRETQPRYGQSLDEAQQY